MGKKGKKGKGKGKGKCFSANKLLEKIAQLPNIMDAVLPHQDQVDDSPQWPGNLVAAFAPADWFAKNFFIGQNDLYFDDFSSEEFYDSYEDSSEESSKSKEDPSEESSNSKEDSSEESSKSNEDSAEEAIK